MFSVNASRLLVTSFDFSVPSNASCHSSTVPYKHQVHSFLPSFPKMTTIPLLGPTPISLGGETLHPDGHACFTCNPPYQHPREWAPNPQTPGRKRTLVLCFDGTGDSFDQDNSNVVQFLAMLKKDDPTEQLVYYQAGIGTYTGNGVLGTPIVQGTSQLLDQMIAWNLPAHIKDGYQFLMQNYHVGDQICIFGFSRGAFTARALAGMLQKVGLLPQFNIEQLPFAYAMYARDDEDGLKLSMQFKRTFSVDVKIQFLGVWDTVQSVGLIPKHLPFSGSNNAIVHFRHALSLDEHRVKFIPFFCTGGKPKPNATNTVTSDADEAARRVHRHGLNGREGSGALEYETHVNNLTGPESDVEEVFFSGAHCDIGGGSVQNGTRHSLARIPLRWMIRECFKVDTGIIFDAHMLNHEVGLDTDSIFNAPNPLSPETHHLDKPAANQIRGFTLSRVPVAIFSGLSAPFRWLGGKVKNLRLRRPPRVVFSPSLELPRFKYEGSEALEELRDALSPVYDQLDLHWYWKVMEWIPWIMKKQSAEVADSDEFWAYKFVWNRGRGRQVYGLVMRRGMKVHRSVKTRMLAQTTQGNGEPYVPKIRCMVNGKPRRLTREEWLAEPPRYFEWVD
ncbi:hypothetical protein BJ322DRAFT_1052259 [Thelephora terrestris]|uniref:T6SS Phospholipase effector Tle1-like catalytic domain-containing protein n=1 Tax=Thelephora terrestris TaxID=56493 RepID=A0A9P6L7L5_9AGAM|nr:hypothetical protein BJ322DRAFT_1052259 [Thelephora terrestris]